MSIQGGVGIFSDRHTQEMHMSLLAMCKYESMKLANMCKKSCYSLCVWTSAITPRSLSRHDRLSPSSCWHEQRPPSCYCPETHRLSLHRLLPLPPLRKSFLWYLLLSVFFPPNLVPEQTVDGWTLSNLSNLLVVQRQWSWGKWTEDILSLQWRKLDFRSERLILREVPVYWKKV